MIEAISENKSRISLSCRVIPPPLVSLSTSKTTRTCPFTLIGITAKEHESVTLLRVETSPCPSKTITPSPFRATLPNAPDFSDKRTPAELYKIIEDAQAEINKSLKTLTGGKMIYKENDTITMAAEE